MAASRDTGLWGTGLQGVGRRRLGSRGALASACILALAGPFAPVPARAEGSALSNLFKFGGTTEPPSQPESLEPPYCPNVDVAEGGAALRTMAGGAVRSQISIGRLGRECTRRQDGSITVKVGVDARVLLGPGGSPGRFEVPITFMILHNDKVVTSRVERTSAVVEPGAAQGFATIVADDITVPAAMTADYEIAVSLGGKGAAPKAKAAAAKPRRRKPETAASSAGDAAPGGAAAPGGEAAQ